MKYRPSRRLALLLGDLSGNLFAELFSSTDWDLIVPIPSSFMSRKTKKFEQGLEICRGIISSLPEGINPQLAPAALNYQGTEVLQASLRPAKRIKNIQNSFTADTSFTANKKILLVDDVLTTGSTAAAAAKALHESGAHSIDLFCLARASTWQSYRAEIYKHFNTATPS